MSEPKFLVFKFCSAKEIDRIGQEISKPNLDSQLVLTKMEILLLVKILDKKNILDDIGQLLSLKLLKVLEGEISNISGPSITAEGYFKGNSYFNILTILGHSTVDIAKSADATGKGYHVYDDLVSEVKSEKAVDDEHDYDIDYGNSSTRNRR